MLRLFQNNTEIIYSKEYLAYRSKSESKNFLETSHMYPSTKIPVDFGPKFSGQGHLSALFTKLFINDLNKGPFQLTDVFNLLVS